MTKPREEKLRIWPQHKKYFREVCLGCGKTIAYTHIEGIKIPEEKFEIYCPKCIKVWQKQLKLKRSESTKE